MMMRTKITYTLVALAAVAAANPLPKNDPTSVAALEDNVTCKPLVLTDEPQCALAIGVGLNDVEESSGLEKRLNIRDALHQFNEFVSMIKEICTRIFFNTCSLNRPPLQSSLPNHGQSEQNQSEPQVPNGHQPLTFGSVLVDLSQPVPGTNIMINENPREFTVSLKNGRDNIKGWKNAFIQLIMTPAWHSTGYTRLYLGDPTDVDISFSNDNNTCTFHLCAQILISMGLSIEKDGDSWYFHLAEQKIQEPRRTQGLDGAPDDDEAQSNENVSDMGVSDHESVLSAD